MKAGMDPDMATFIGKNADYYARKWASTNRDGKPNATWNGAAFAGGPIWLVYRKMYWQAAVYLIATVLLSLLLDSVSSGLSAGASYGIPAAFGFAANHLYRHQVEQIVEQVRAEDLQPYALVEQLRRRGGTNPGAAWVVGVLVVGVSALFVVSALNL